MSDSTKKKWNDEQVNKMLELVGSESPVSGTTVASVADAIGVSARSVASKLRQLKRDVASMAKEKVPTFDASQTAELSAFVNSNAGLYTYKEIAERFMSGKFSAKEIQGKLLALELTDKVRPADKVEVARLYTPEQEAQFVAMANGGSYLEDIAAGLGKELASVRGKALSLFRTGVITAIPKQKEHRVKEVVDPVASIPNLATLTVSEIAKLAEKTERGIRTLLTRRGIKVADYDGHAKREKALAKKEKAEA